jgi:UDP-N-acetylmuramoylalanine--D-glutamate ligase
MIRIAEYKTIAIFGLGVSGLAVLRSAAATPGITAFASDDNQRAIETARGEIGDCGNRITFADIEQFPWDTIEALVLSPGVPPSHAVFALAQQHNCCITVDIELLWHAEYDNAIFVGVTGTNGKSTTATLLGDMLRAGGLDVEVAGNIGMPVMACQPGRQVYVLELSSFQLDLLNAMSFDGAVLLNITPDHLDRYGTLVNYIGSKRRILHRSSELAPVVLGVGSEITAALARSIRRAKHPNVKLVSGYINRSFELDAYCHNGALNLMVTGRRHKRVNLRDRATLLGRHNEENIAAAAMMASCLDVPHNVMERTIKDFEALPHRMQEVARIGSIVFIDDSKATTPQSMRGAVLALHRDYDIFLIVGGREKYVNSIYGERDIMLHVQEAYAIGEATEAFYDGICDVVATHKCYTLDQAVAAAYESALRNIRPAAILLSPACSSHDQWRSFEERGRAFAEIATRLTSVS